MADKQPTYEEMLTEVEAIIADLQEEDMPLDRVISMVKRGYTLLTELKNRLDTVSLQITELRDGNTTNEEQS